MSQISLIRNVAGFAGRSNDILYKLSISKSNKFLIFFGGDCQDLQEKMLQHNDSKKYIEWSLENTAEILSKSFPQNHIIIIRPSRMTILSNAALSCFDNFVQSDKFGIPKYGSPYVALKHLQNLMTTLLKNPILKQVRKDARMELKIVGFSKGCVVLNQILYEFNHFQVNSQSNGEINSIIKCIKSMWWLDGGHAGTRDAWVTDQNILQSFAKLGIKVYIHVTPYQICDVHRPWIGREEADFYNILKSLNVSTERVLHFSDRTRSLSNHFQILKIIKETEEHCEQNN